MKAANNVKKVLTKEGALVLILSLTLFVLGITTEAYAATDTRADCVSTNTVSYFPLGYDPALGKYLSDVERKGLSPAVEVSISYRGLCNYQQADIRLQQFKFFLKIKGYRNGIVIPLLKSVDLQSVGASLTFSVPEITPGNYTGTLMVQDISILNSGTREIDLNQFIRVSGSASSPTPTPTPSATGKLNSSFRNLYDIDYVWIVGGTAEVYSCWSNKPKSGALQVKVRNYWKTKATGKVVKDSKLCSTGFPWAIKYLWAVDEFGEIPRANSKSRLIMAREVVNKTIITSPVSRIIYASNNDRISEGLSSLDKDLGLSLR